MAVCKLCSQDLVLELDPDDFNEATSGPAGGFPSTVPDDLALSCGCHFHWQCLLDDSSIILASLSCPSCNAALAPSANTTSSAAFQPRQILTRYHNEGGVQDDLDILPLIIEEAYLRENEAARPARAYLTMCAEADVAAIVELVKAVQEDPDEDGMSAGEILRYQDPLDGMKTGLHFAIEKSQEEVVWVLLWLASGVPTQAFPEEVLSAAEVMGAGRDTAQGSDIRSLRDEQGRTGGDAAGSMGSTWAGLLGAGVLGG